MLSLFPCRAWWCGWTGWSRSPRGPGGSGISGRSPSSYWSGRSHWSGCSLYSGYLPFGLNKISAKRKNLVKAYFLIDEDYANFITQQDFKYFFFKSWDNTFFSPLLVTFLIWIPSKKLLFSFCKLQGCKGCLLSGWMDKENKVPLPFCSSTSYFSSRSFTVILTHQIQSRIKN